MAQVLIAGYGYIGSALSMELAGSGHTVFGLRRREKTTPRGVRLINADLTALEALSKLPAGLDFVFYTVGSNSSSDDSYQKAYVLGLHNLLTVLSEARQNPRRIFFVSSTGVYEQQHGEWVDESSPTDPSRAQGRLRCSSGSGCR
jgi:nucleoside-diphosphate-sugar epimerase